MTTITLNVSLSPESLRFVNLKDLDNPAKLIDHLSFTRFDMSNMGYVLVGKLEVDVSLLPPDQIVDNAVLALRAKAASIRAEATAKATQLEGMAQQLLAIENKA
jgi:hypothetical protein